MAEASLSSAILEDFLTCSICFEIYKEPKILPCLHTFCLCCLTKLIDGSSLSILRCPKCRNETSLPENGALGLNTNFYIVNLTEVVQTKDVGASETLCSFCITKGDNTPASFKCLDCGDSLCKTCSNSHTLTRLTMHHRVVDFTEVRNGKYDDQLRSSQGILCSIHKEEKFQYFCSTCDKPVCRDCVLLLHKLHDCTTIEDALQSRIGAIKDLMKEVEGCLKKHTTDEEGLNNRLRELRSEESQLHIIANKLADRVIENVRRQRNEVKAKITQCFQKPKEETCEEIETRKNTTKIFKESLQFCQSIIRNGKDVEILALEELLRKRLTDLQRVPRDPKTNMFNRKHATLQLTSRFDGDLQLTSSFDGDQKIFQFSEITSENKAVQKMHEKQKEISTESTTQVKTKTQNTQGDKQREITPGAKQTTQHGTPREITPNAKQTTQDGNSREITPEAKQTTLDGKSREITPGAKQTTQDGNPREITSNAKQTTQDGKSREITLASKQTTQDGKPREVTPKAKQTTQGNKPREITLEEAKQITQDSKPREITPHAKQKLQDSKPREITPASKQTTQEDKPREVPPGAKQTTQGNKPREITSEAKQTTQDGKPREITPQAKQITQDSKPREITPDAKQKLQDSKPREITTDAKQKLQDSKPREITPDAKQKLQDSKPREITPDAKQKLQDSKPREITPNAKQKLQDSKPREITPAETKQITKDGKSAVGSSGETNLKLIWDVQPGRKNIHKLTFIKTFNSVRENSKNKPKLTSVAWLNASSFTVADNNNDLVYTINLSGQILAKARVKKPLTMTTCSGNIVCFSENHLNIAEPDGKILTKEMCKGYRIYPVTTKGANFLVGNITPGVIKEFSGEKVVKSITIKNEKNEEVKFNCFALCANQEGHMAISDKCNCRIIFVRKDGQCVYWVNTNEEGDNRPIWQPNTIAFDQYDNVFSVCYETSRLIVLSPEEGYAAVSHFHDKLKFPRSLAIFGDNLLVTDSNGYIHQFCLEYRNR